MSVSPAPSSAPTAEPGTDALPSPDAPLFPVALTGGDFDRGLRYLRRFSPDTVWRRLRMPLRNWNRARRNARRIAPFAKAPMTAPPAPGAALVLANLGGNLGLSRGALYDLGEYILPLHDDVTFIDISRPGRDCLPPDWDPAKRFTHVYMHGMPESCSRVWALLDPAQMEGAWRTAIWVWETENFPPGFRHALTFAHEIWAPSEFSAGAFRKEAGPDIAVRVKPYAVQIDPAVPALPRERFGVADGAFLGVAIMDLVSCPHRKNPWAHVAAWQKAFGRDPRAVLLMKVRSARRTAPVMAELAQMIDGADNIRLIDGWFSADEITGFQKMADVYLSLHRSEGYGLNIHECLLQGVPVIATHWSASAEFAPSHAGYHPVPARLVPYEGDWLMHYPGTAFRWAEADTDAAARLLRRVAQDRFQGGQAAAG